MKKKERKKMKKVGAEKEERKAKQKYERVNV